MMVIVIVGWECGFCLHATNKLQITGLSYVVANCVRLSVGNYFLFCAMGAAQPCECRRFLPDTLKFQLSPAGLISNWLDTYMGWVSFPIFNSLKPIKRRFRDKKLNYNYFPE